jgi:hypothetical protein
MSDGIELTTFANILQQALPAEAPPFDPRWAVVGRDQEKLPPFGGRISSTSLGACDRELRIARNGVALARPDVHAPGRASLCLLPAAS